MRSVTLNTPGTNDAGRKQSERASSFDGHERAMSPDTPTRAKKNQYSRAMTFSDKQSHKKEETTTLSKSSGNANRSNSKSNRLQDWPSAKSFFGKNNAKISLTKTELEDQMIISH